MEETRAVGLISACIHSFNLGPTENPVLSLHLSVKMMAAAPAVKYWRLHQDKLLGKACFSVSGSSTKALVETAIIFYQGPRKSVVGPLPLFP